MHLVSSENDSSSHEVTPEHTLVESMESLLLQQQQQQLLMQQHRKLSQQNSLDKLAAEAGAGGGPQTIADLQQKLVQLTSQPTESLNVSTPPISHPATPHNSSQVAGGYDAYMHNLQQKLVNIGMPPVASTNAQSLVRKLLSLRFWDFSQLVLENIL